MAKPKNLTILMKRLVAVMSMTAAISFSMLSQKPQTGFSDLKHRRPGHSGSQIMAPQVYDNDLINPGKNAGSDLEKFKYDEDDAWTRTSFINLGYLIDQTLKIGGTNIGYNEKYGAGLQVGNSYMLPKKAIFDMVKIGIDATWFDFSWAQYQDARYGCHHLTAGMGIGGSVHIAPFVNVAEALRPLRVECYCRFVPSYSLFLRKSNSKYEDEYGEIVKDDHISARGAFMPVVSCGFAIDYRAIGVGYEYRFGTADHKDLTDDGRDMRYDMTSGRVYISFRM